jgi:hypothetical protein
MFAQLMCTFWSKLNKHGMCAKLSKNAWINSTCKLTFMRPLCPSLLFNLKKMQSKFGFYGQETNIFNQCVNICIINVRILI